MPEQPFDLKQLISNLDDPVAVSRDKRLYPHDTRPQALKSLADQYAYRAQGETNKHALPIETAKGTEYLDPSMSFANNLLDKPAMAIMNLLKNIPGWIK